MTLYKRIQAHSGELTFQQSTSGTLTLTEPTGGYHFDPQSITPPPPPPSGTWLPVPSGWKLQTQYNLTGLSSLPSTFFSYGGAPGGTSGCLWNSSQLSFTASGIEFTAAWNGTVWLCAGIGTNASWDAPYRVRVYEQLLDCNINGLNHIDLMWCSPWNTEIDYREAQADNGVMEESHVNIHNESSGDVIPTFANGVQDLNEHCYEVQVANTQIETFTDGVASGGPETIPAADWNLLESDPHWVGVQTQMYSVGSASKTAISKRLIRGIEILVPA